MQSPSSTGSPTSSPYPYKGMLCTQETVVSQPSCSQLNPSAVCFPASIVGQARAAGTSSSSLGSPLGDTGHERGAVAIGRGSRLRAKLRSIKQDPGTSRQTHPCIPSPQPVEQSLTTGSCTQAASLVRPFGRADRFREELWAPAFKWLAIPVCNPNPAPEP